MENSWNTQEEIDRFTNLWNRKFPSRINHTEETWNIRADDWEKQLQTNKTRRERSEKRINATVSFLREHGLLNPADNVIDVGCGPGRFVAEFAKTVHHATGTDLSQRMLEHGAAFAASQGISNVSYVPCNFKQVDIDALGWRKQFDLVFTSITPAVSRKEDIEKIIAMSRGWCFHSSFLNVKDSLLIETAREVFGKEPPERWDGRVFYALFNILWLRGFCPHVTYYTEKSIDEAGTSLLFARDTASNLGIGEEDTASVEKIRRYLLQKADKDGKIFYPHEFTYVWMLWDVRTQYNRDIYEG